MFCHGSVIETWNASKVLSFTGWCSCSSLKMFEAATREADDSQATHRYHGNCAAFDTNKEENPIDPTSSSTTSSDGLFCSSLLLQNLVCIVHRISLLPMGQLWARSYHYKSGFCKEAPWSRNWVDHSCNSLWLGKVWQFYGNTWPSSYRIKENSKEAITICQRIWEPHHLQLFFPHLPAPAHPSITKNPQTAHDCQHPLTQSNDSHIVPCWSCPHRMFPNWWDHQTNESITGKRWKTSFDRGGCLCQLEFNSFRWENLFGSVLFGLHIVTSTDCFLFLFFVFTLVILPLILPLYTTLRECLWIQYVDVKGQIHFSAKGKGQAPSTPLWDENCHEQPCSSIALIHLPYAIILCLFAGTLQLSRLGYWNICINNIHLYVYLLYNGV